MQTQDEKWNRALDLFIESVHKPDSKLRGCAHNQECYHELMYIRSYVLDYIQSLRR
jgi:hypothetical protein